MVSTDSYFRTPRIAERFPLYFDDPRAVKLSLLRRQMLGWRRGQDIRLNPHDLVSHGVGAEKVVKAVPVLFVEGFMAFHPLVREAADLRVFMDSVPSKRLKKRYKRDVLQRGRKVAYVRDRFFSTLEEARIQFAENWRSVADLMVVI
ncbi:MAG: hypothetical protein Q7R47_04610 [Candidatus Diapherotrites archaeon]|nr:hypothetical protein [Candidatus Diapherotrites archaeon]